MFVAVQEEVDARVEEELLQGDFELRRAGVAVAVAGAVERSVAVHDDPGHLVAVGVGLGEVLLQPGVLRQRVDARLDGVGAGVDLRADRDVVHEPVVPAEEPIVGGVAVLGLDLLAAVGRHEPERLAVVAQVRLAVLVVSDAHHVGDVRGDLLHVAEELVPDAPVVIAHVVRKVARVEDHRGLVDAVRELADLRDQPDGVVLGAVGRGAREVARADGAQREGAGRAHVAKDDVALRQVRRQRRLRDLAREVEDLRGVAPLADTVEVLGRRREAAHLGDVVVPEPPRVLREREHLALGRAGQLRLAAPPAHDRRRGAVLIYPLHGHRVGRRADREPHLLRRARCADNQRRDGRRAEGYGGHGHSLLWALFCGRSASCWLFCGRWALCQLLLLAAPERLGKAVGWFRLCVRW